VVGAVEGVAVPPGVDAHEVQGGGVVQVGLGQSAVAGSAQASGVGSLADGALDTGMQGVVALPGAVLLLFAGGVDGLGPSPGPAPGPREPVPGLPQEGPFQRDQNDSRPSCPRHRAVSGG